MLREVFGGEPELAIVPRIETGDGRPVSATRVRKAYREEAWQELDSLVPPATLEYLRKHRLAISSANIAENE